MKGLKFDYICEFNEGYAWVYIDGKYNHIDMNGDLISDQWWDNCYDFNNGYAKVWLKGKGCNHINTNGKLLSEQWWDWCGDFYGGYATIRLNGKCNSIDTKGNIKER